MKQTKLGHQVPKGRRVNRFNSIEINGDFAYCASHNFVFNPEEEERKLYNGEACYYTDNRYKSTPHNYYKNTMLYWTRYHDISLKSCIRRTLKCANIPINTIIKFNKSWRYTGQKFSGSYNFKIKHENKLDITYEINNPTYNTNFIHCKRSRKLVDELRANGFLVSVTKNTSFIKNMLNTAISYTNSGKPIDSSIDGESAIVYGYGKKIGFSSFNNNYMGYSNGCDNILWDSFKEFNKWSQCNEIPKNKSTKEIIKILKELL